MADPQAIRAMKTIKPNDYDRLKRRDREVLRVAALSPEDIEVIAAAKLPAEASAFDHEVE